jgi:hypothetical protein
MQRSSRRRGPIRAAVLAAVVAALLVPAASVSAASSPKGVLVVLLRLDVGCGGPRICTPQLMPYAGGNVEIRAVGRPLKLARVSDDAGRVSLGLRTGLYTVVPHATDALAPKPVQVRVRAGLTTRIRLVLQRPKM